MNCTLDLVTGSEKEKDPCHERLVTRVFFFSWQLKSPGGWHFNSLEQDQRLGGEGLLSGPPRSV